MDVHTCWLNAGSLLHSAADFSAPARVTGTVLGRPSWLPVPDFALQTLLGEGAGVVLEGQRVLPARAQVRSP